MRPTAARVQTRVALSKEERKSLRAKRRAGLSGASLLADFADDAAGVLGVASGGEAAFLDRVRLGQKFGGAVANERSAPASGGVHRALCCAVWTLP